MEVFTAVRNQSIFDLCVQLYGTAKSMDVLINGTMYGDLNMTDAITPGRQIEYDREIDVTEKKVLKKMENKIVFTYKNIDNDSAEYNLDFNFDFTS